MKSYNVKNAVRFALTAGVAASFVNAPAYAQEEDAAALERVEVTGSRIKRTQIETAQPIAIIQREDIERTGLTSVGELLQELPSAGSSINTNFNNGGDGSTTIDLRNLGANRVLVLVNGRRWVPGLFGTVDLNSIPLSVIERIEVLKDGASSIYGSDAIAGVVNIFTRRDYDGADATAQIGEFDEGDGRQEFYNFSIGSTGNRGSVFMNSSYLKQEPVWAGDRPISAEPYFETGITFGSSGTPQGRFLGYTSGFASFFDDTIELGDPGPDNVGNVVPFSTVGRFNFAPDNYLSTPFERTGLYVQGSYDVTDNITFSTEALYNNRASEQLLAPTPLFIGYLLATPTSNAGEITIDANNAFNPYGVNLHSNYYDFAGDPGSSWLLLAGRRMVEAGPRIFTQDVDTYRFGAGFEGNFEAGGRFFDWDFNYVYTDNHQNDINVGELNMVRVEQALGASGAEILDADGNGTGDFECLDASLQVIRGCASLNLFGGQAGGSFNQNTGEIIGTMSDRQLNWILFTSQDTFRYTMRNITGNISSEIVELPAGPLGVALGFEHRREEGFDQPDALIVSGATSGNARQPTRGGYKVDEIYGEVALPLLADIPAVELLELSLSLRSSDYDTFGSTSNGKVGVRWEPTSDLLIRGTFSEGFRAPSIGELFRGNGDSFPNISDPCNTANFPTQPAHVQQRCLDDGVPPGGVVQANTQIRITVGGNPNLQPEESESTTVGFVYSPNFVDGLDISVDWYSIELTDAITSISGQRILNECYTRAPGERVFCEFVTRNASGGLSDIFSGLVNIDGLEVEGVDFNVAYALPEFAFGRLKLNWDSSYVSSFKQLQEDAISGEFTEFELSGTNIGDTGFPRWKSNLGVAWSYGDWEAAYDLRYIHHQLENCPSNLVGLTGSDGAPLCTFENGNSGSGRFGETDPVNKIGGVTYHDVQVSYFVPGWDTRVTFGINNLFDKEPPQSYQAFANTFDPTLYRIPGMFPYLRVSKTF